MRKPILILIAYILVGILESTTYYICGGDFMGAIALLTVIGFMITFGASLEEKGSPYNP